MIILEKPDTLAALQDHISSTAFDLAGTRLWAFLSSANGLFFRFLLFSSTIAYDILSNYSVLSL